MSIYPQANRRHVKYKKRNQAERTQTRKLPEQEQKPKKNPRIHRLDTRKTLPPGTNTNRIWRAQKGENKELHLHRKRNKETARQKFCLTGAISIQERWQTRMIGKEASRQQEAAGRNNMQPIWGYRCQLRTNAKPKNSAIKKLMGPKANG